MNQKELFYQKLKNKLSEKTSFPSKYLFKFIVKNKENLIAEVIQIFEGMRADVKKTPSKNENFMSVSVLVLVCSADEVIKKYQEAEVIEGIISL